MDNSLAYIQTSTNILSQNPTDLHSLKSIHNLFLVLKSNSQHGDVLYPEYQKLYDLLTSLNAHSSPEKCFCDPAARTFFLNKLVPTIAKAILATKKKYSDEIEGIIYNCLQQITLLCLNSISEGQNSLLETTFIILDPHKPFYAHPIPSRSLPINDNCNKLTLFEDLISHIKSNGVKLFDRLYEKVNDTNNIPSIKMMGFVCLIACKLQYFYPHSLALDHMDRVREAVHHRLFSNATSYINSFVFVDYKVAVKGFKTLFKASIASPEERHRALDILKLQISKICLSSDNEASNDLGFRVIQDVIVDLGNQRSSQLKILSRPACHEFLRSIFDENPKALFRNMRVQKSPKLFRMMYKCDLLQSHEYQSLWLNLKRACKAQSHQKHQKLLILKVFSRGQVHSLFERLMLENFKKFPEELGPGDIRLISAIHCEYSRLNEFSAMVEKLYWEIMMNNDRIKGPRILESVIFDYLRLTDGHDWSKPVVKIINECIENIETNITNFTFFRIIQKLPVGYILTEREYIKQKKVLHLLMEHIRLFKAQNTPTSNIDNESSYLSQISERINCLRFLLDRQVSEQPDLNYEMLEEMWTMLVEHALFPPERDFFLAILNELMKSEDGLMIRPEDLKRFFEQKILNKDVQHHYLRMSKDGALCFHNFFIAVNHNLKKIWRSRITSKYDVKVVPEELEAFEDVWSFVMSCEDPKASYRATDILVRTNNRLEDQFEPDLNSIRERLIARCFEYMQPSCPSSCCRAGLEIIKKMMYNSGREGILELDGHTKLQKSDIYELNLNVSDFQKPENDNKNNKKVITCSSNSTVVDVP